MTNWVDKKASVDDWLTPEEILGGVREYFERIPFEGTLIPERRIPLDPCTEPDNPTHADKFFTKEDDGLSKDWQLESYGAGVFVNPPYSKGGVGLLPQIRVWVAKIHEEARKGLQIIGLLPAGARFSTGYWQDHVLVSQLRCMTFICGRVAFINARTREEKRGQNNHDSILYGWNTDPERWKKCFGYLGATFEVRG